MNNVAQGGILTADVTAGLPAGAYRLCSINTAANHQPAIVPIAQHGSLDDCVYVCLNPPNDLFSLMAYCNSSLHLLVVLWLVQRKVMAEVV